MVTNNGYWFYVSYSGRDAKGNEFIKRFHRDLAGKIATEAKLTADPGQIGFFYEDSIELGAEWPRKQAEALATTRSLVCIYSPEYFRSEMCGKEVQAFLARLKSYSGQTSGKEERPPLILPVLWYPPDKLPQLPPSVATIQYVHDDFGATYAKEGLRNILRLGKDKDYREFLAAFAKQIIRLTSEYRLPTAQEIPALSDIPSAFAIPEPEKSAPTISPRATTTKGLPFSGATSKIIRRAKEFARRVESGSVTTSFLLFAIDDVGGTATSDTIPRFLHEQLAAIPREKYDSVRSAYFPKLEGKIPDEELTSDISAGEASANAWEVFEKAKEFSELTPGDGKIQVRHLLAALLVHNPGAHYFGARERLKELGIDSLTLRQGLLEAVTRLNIGVDRGKDSLPIWQFILLPEQADQRRRMSGFDSDVYTDEDLLGIDKDVDAFATLIAARTVTPPLSIGIFGDWGSGKSFFMHRLIKRVDEVTAEARKSEKPQNELGIYRRIAQIEFNAWHYVEGNLWASLVENIFENLKISQSENSDDDALVKRREALLDTLKVEEAAKTKVEGLAKEAQEKLEKKDDEIKDVAKAHKDKTDRLAELSSEDALASIQLSIQLNPQAKAELDSILKLAGVSMLGEATRDLQSALGEARSVYERGNTLLTPMLKAPNGRKRFIKLVLILVAAPVIGLVVRYVFKRYNAELGELSGYVAGVTALTTAAAGWIKQQAAWTSDRIKETEELKLKVDKQVEEQMAEVRAQNAKEMATYTQELELLKTQYAALLSERAEVQKRVEAINAELAQSSAVQMLAKFIQDRAASDDYRKYLGLLALIRRDFSSLSKLIEKGNLELGQTLAEGKVEEDVAPVNRIVLYIDDLDRCPPRKVIAVLQAVHLLLAFPLFVVVVGVDGRWVAQSLKKSYPGLLSEGTDLLADSATPHDYLEKIFQIPFWLNPLETDSTTQMLRKLMPVTSTNGELQVAALEAKPKSSGKTNQKNGESLELKTSEPDSPSGEPTQVGEVKTEDADDRIPMLQGATETQQKQSSPSKPAREINLNPDSLDIVKAELEFVEALTPLLGRSPRAVKRFINIYRLVKVGLEPLESASFLADTAPLAQFKVVMFLLSIATGMPAISRELFQTLMQVEEDQRRNPGSTRTADHDFEWLLKRASGQATLVPHSGWSCLEEWLKGHENGNWLKLDIGVAAAWSNRIARYSFNIRQGMN